MLATERNLALGALVFALSMNLSVWGDQPDFQRDPPFASHPVLPPSPRLSTLGAEWQQLPDSEQTIRSTVTRFTDLEHAPEPPAANEVDLPELAASQLPAPPVASHESSITISTHGNSGPIAPGMSGFRASVEVDAEPWMGPYFARAAEHHNAAPWAMDGTMQPIPTAFIPWWDEQVRKAHIEATLPVGVDWLVQSALSNSPNIRGIQTEPHIRQSVLLEESAEFDWRSFLETTYDDIDDPVGNTLTTGNNDDRFKDRLWHAKGGFRRRNQLGGDFEVSQQFGRQRNNSIFLLPNPQGTARMELAYTQPLLNGAGKAYNNSRIVLAQIDTNASRDEVVDRLQDHLLRVTEAYWDLYRSRARYLQRIRLRDEAIKIARSLAEREQVDALHRQVLRANAAVARRQSEIARAHTEIKNAEAALRLLVNDPALIQHATGELTPVDAPSLSAVDLSMSDSLSTALSNRPDISRAIRAMRATMVRIGVARNEILPRLGVLVSTYVAGLEGRADVLNAWENQFNIGSPGFMVGLEFEVPLGARAAKARYQRRNWEMVKAVSEFRNTVETSLTEVGVVRARGADDVSRDDRQVSGDGGRHERDRIPERTGFARFPARTILPRCYWKTCWIRRNGSRTRRERSWMPKSNTSTSLVRLRKAIGTLLTCQDSSY